MCLAIPAKVLEVQPDGWAEVDVGGVRSRVCLTLLDDVVVGDYVIIHAGFALTRLNVEEAEKTLALFAEISAALKITANALPQRIP
jgi:hydrogenase expression/formation protein HypC